MDIPQRRRVEFFLLPNIISTFTLGIVIGRVLYAGPPETERSVDGCSPADRMLPVYTDGGRSCTTMDTFYIFTHKMTTDHVT